MSDNLEPKKSPLQEITQPFVDLFHAPRALWGINLAYVLEGMVYFGMLGYLTIYCSEFIFQAIDGADEAAHYMVMVLTAGITIAMFFLGVVADKRGVRFALIAAFILMLAGRVLWAGAPTLFGLEPARPTVVAGDRVSLHVTELGTKRGNKAITEATIIANQPGAIDVDTLGLNLTDGEGIAPSESLESKLVRLDRIELVEGEGQEWTVRYGTEPITAKLMIRGAKDLHLKPGNIISLDRAYVTLNEEEDKEHKPAPTTVLHDGAVLSLSQAQVVKAGEDGDEFVIKVNWPDGVRNVVADDDDGYLIRSHWVSDIAAINTFAMDLAEGEGIPLSADLDTKQVQLSEATLVEGEDGGWIVEYGDTPISARLVFEGEAIGITQTGFLTDLAAGIASAPSEELAGQAVQVGQATLVSRDGDQWRIQYGEPAVTTALQIRSGKDATLGIGTVISLRRADVVSHNDGYALSANWPADFAAVNTYDCPESPYLTVITTDERDLKVTTSTAMSGAAELPEDATPVTISQLRDMEEGDVNAVLRDVNVTYVRNGGYLLQTDKESPGIFVFVSPFWSPLQIVTMLGMFLVVIGYGMYQPAAYAGVRKFTTPKTAAMGFAMLYALMNLGGWLPSFAFLLRDDDYAGLGIPGTFWVYAGFTVIALVATVFILSRRTVAEAEATAKAETARLEAEQKEEGEAKPEEKSDSIAADQNDEPLRIKPHMWLFWVGAMILFIFKGESPWFYGWSEASWRWIIAGVIFVLPAFLAAIPAARRWIARHPLEDAKFAYFIFALIPVQTLFTYNWLVLPPYIKRSFDGWIGEYFEIAANSNPILIFIAVPLIVALTQKAKVYNMMILGTFIMAAPAFLLVIGPHWWTLAAYILIMTIGEAMWQPRFLQYAAEIAPEGRTGEYMGVAQLPWFLTKVLVPLLYSGKMMDKFCPAEGPQNTQAMWFIFACIAMMSTVLLVLAKNWIGKDFKTKHG